MKKMSRKAKKVIAGIAIGTIITAGIAVKIIYDFNRYQNSHVTKDDLNEMVEFATNLKQSNGNTNVSDVLAKIINIIKNGVDNGTARKVIDKEIEAVASGIEELI